MADEDPPTDPRTSATSTPAKPRPLVLPEPFSGDGCFSDWIEHFESVAAVNSWDDAAKALWLRVRLTGKAQTAYKRLSDDARKGYADSVKALRERFEPKSKRELYVAEFRARRKKKTEDWADYADELRVLADKAYSDLQDEARERIALNHFLEHLDNPQVAFNVKQRSPKNLADAASATIELESYLSPRASHVSIAEEGQKGVAEVVAAFQSQQETMMDMIQKLVERVEKLENNQTGRQPPKSPASADGPPKSSTPIICRRCGQEGHYQRGCARRGRLPGN